MLIFKQEAIAWIIVEEDTEGRKASLSHSELKWKRLVLFYLTEGNSLQWRHNERNGVSNHQPHDCLLNRLFRRISKKPSKLRVTGLCVWNLPVTGEFPAQRASNAEKVSIWWCQHVGQLYAMCSRQQCRKWRYACKNHSLNSRGPINKSNGVDCMSSCELSLVAINDLWTVVGGHV